MNQFQENNSNLRIMYLNTQGQTKFTHEKQLHIKDLICEHKCDILHLQEVEIDSDSFSRCPFITNNFTILTNNSSTTYGTASLICNDLEISNVSFDTEGRIIVFDVGPLTTCNVYLTAGSDAVSRSLREKILCRDSP